MADNKPQDKEKSKGDKGTRELRSNAKRKKTDKEQKESSKDKDRILKEKERDKERERYQDKERDKHEKIDREKGDKEKIDKERDRYRKRSKSRSPGRTKEGSNSSGTTNTKGEIEMSIEETNKLRISLGLKPLIINPKEDKEKEAQRQKEREETTKEHESSEIKARIAKAKHKRELYAKVGGPSIADLFATETENTSTWVEKSRTIEEERLRKEKEMAMKRSQMLDEEDNLFQGSIQKTVPEYSQKDLKGLKIAHDLQGFEIEGQTILTLKDTLILADANNINEDDDELMNIQLAEAEKLKKNKELKKKKPIYNVYDEDKKTILPQYDEEKPNASFTLDDSGAVNLEEKKKMEDIRMKLAAPGKLIYDLDISKKTASEYFTSEELVKFKKNTGSKKKKIRKKKLELEDLEAPSPSSADHGSRKTGSTKEKVEQKKAEGEQVQRQKNYEKALEKANEDTKFLFDEQEGPEQDDKELLESLNRAKQLTGQKKNAVAQLVERVKQREMKKEEIPSKDSGLVFTTTTEFIRAIQPMEEIAPKPKKSAKNKDAMDIDTEDIEDHEKMLREQAKKEAMKRKRELKDDIKEEEEEEEEKEPKIQKKEPEINPQDTVTLSEPLVAQGMAATLQLMRQKGVETESTEIYAGRRTDKKADYGLLDDLKKQKTAEKEKKSKPKGDYDFSDIRLSYVDEFGRTMTPKEAFRVISHTFHGKKPGKNKQEKRLKQYMEEQKRASMSSTDTPLMSVAAMQAEQEKLQTPYIVISGSNLKLPVASVTEPKELPLQKGNQTAPMSGGRLEGEFHEFKLGKPGAKKK